MNVFFRLTAAAGTVFVVTILALVAALLGNPQAPPARFLDRHGGRLLAGEVVVILVCGFLALAIDRAEILRAQRAARDKDRAA